MNINSYYCAVDCPPTLKHKGYLTLNNPKYDRSGHLDYFGFCFYIMNYSEKLKSPKWQKKRLEILQRDNFKCCLCGDNETELHVHHLKYSGKPYEAPEDDLQTLCKVCHEFETLLHKKGEALIFVKKLSNNFFGKLKSGNITVGWFNPKNDKYFSIIVDKPNQFKEIINILIK